MYSHIDVISKDHSAMEKVLNSGACCLSLFLRVDDVLSDRCTIHLPKSQRHERVPVSKRQSRRGWVWRSGAGEKFITMATGKGGKFNLIMLFAAAAITSGVTLSNVRTTCFATALASLTYWNYLSMKRTKSLRDKLQKPMEIIKSSQGYFLLKLGQPLSGFCFRCRHWLQRLTWVTILS